MVKYKNSGKTGNEQGGIGNKNSDRNTEAQRQTTITPETSYGECSERLTVNIDTTVVTVYGAIEGSRKGHNPKHRGKKGLRPVLCFLEETREYLCGTQRRGETIRNEEVARQIRQFCK